MTIPLPEGVESGRVRFRLIQAVLDTDDPDDEPEAIPVEGEITFTASRSTITVETADTMVAPGPFTVPLVNGEMDERIVATDTEEDSWHYNVEFNLIGVDIESFDLEVPTDSDIDLTDYTPVVIIDGEVTVRGPRGYSTFIDDATATTVPYGFSPTVTFAPATFEADHYEQDVAFEIPAGKPAPVLYEVTPGVYSTRVPGGQPHVFIGAVNPDLIPGQMLDGDTWLDTTDPGTTGNPPMAPIYGNGVPEGAVAAPVGSEYIDLSQTRGARKWFKASGTATTGWIVLLGDTGWVPATVPTGWALASSVPQHDLRRINHRVFFRARVSPTGATIGQARTTSLLYQFDTTPSGFGGFRPEVNSYAPRGTWSRAGTGPMLMASLSTYLRLDMYSSTLETGVWAGTDIATMAAEWNTDASVPWPTSLVLP